MVKLYSSATRIIREGVVVFTGDLLALKRFKDDVKDVAKGYDCGIRQKDTTTSKKRDVIESYHEVKVLKKKLK
jgi:translation initiation factor IF-2